MSRLNTCSVTKHIKHISHFPCVPTPNVLVETQKRITHMLHIRHSFCIPLRNVAVEMKLHKSFHKHFQYIHSVFQRPNVIVYQTFCDRAQTIHSPVSAIAVLQTTKVYPQIAEYVGARKFFSRAVFQLANVAADWLNANVSESKNIDSISVTFSVFQLPMSWLNAEASKNINCILVTCAVFQLPMSWLNARSGMKHVTHTYSHLRCVPTPNVLVERRSGKQT